MRLTAALTCAALLMFGVARAHADSPQGERRGRCPPTCKCRYDDGYLVYNCGEVIVRTRDNHSFEINCQDDIPNICNELPFIQLSSNDTIDYLALNYCPVPETFRCLLAKLGAADAKMVDILGPRRELRVKNMEGLATQLILNHPAHQSSVPYYVLRALPSFELSRLSGAEFHFAHELPRGSFAYYSKNIRTKEVFHAFGRLKGETTLNLDNNEIWNINNQLFIGE
ncbi:hypothetical protein evm_014026 [Chilo suppressalis]|nr:hypothetical protein evm_014026 [Chilo suppressalis]